jgi:hypothetical protein
MADVLPQIQIKEGSLVLAREAQPNEAVELVVTFKSRGMSFWYFQVKEAREIRDFALQLVLPDLPKAKLNYPEGCMTPTEVKLTTDNQGSILIYRLDHALSNKGMGIALPQLPQPGATTSAVLTEVERAWLLGFAMIALTLTLSGMPHGVLLTTLFGTATAFVYGLLGDFSDVLLGFWGTAGLIQLPLFLFLTWLLKRVVPGGNRLWWALLLLIGVVYPALAGLDSVRQTLYLNVCAALLLGFVAWLLVQRIREAPVAR